MKAVFITGTDTGVGKTIVSGLLGQFLMHKGYQVITQKWIQTGAKKFSEDVEVHLKLMNKKKKELENYLYFMSPYIFKFASSPHLAARRERRSICVDKIKKSFKFLARRFDFVIVEGVGGALVPFNKKKLVIDIARELNLPVIIVAKNKLGAINHTLLTIEAIRARNLKIVGVIFNSQSANSNNTISRDNPQIIRLVSGEKILGVLPWSQDKDVLYRRFTTIGKKIISNLT